MKNSHPMRWQRSLVGFAATAALGLNVAACNAAAADIGTCPTAAEQDIAAGQKLVESCNSCHSFDSGNLGASRAVTIWDSIDSGSMPPGGSFSDTEIEQARSFLACVVAPNEGGGAAGGSSADGGSP